MRPEALRGPVEDLLRRAAPRLPHVNAAVVAATGHGKSTLVNSFCSVVAGRELTVTAVGGSNGAQGAVGRVGNITLAPQILKLLDLASAMPPGDFDVRLLDLPGYAGTNRELFRQWLLGKVEHNERVPDHPDRLTEVMQRPRTPMQAAHCLVLAVPASALVGTESLQWQGEIFNLAADFSANVPGGGTFNLPVHLVVTKCDEWGAQRGLTNPAELLARESSAACKPLYDAALAKFGIRPLDVTVLGWLHGSAVPYDDASQPIVLTLRHLLLSVVSKASLFIKVNNLVSQ
jgi:hypothetical protein